MSNIRGGELITKFLGAEALRDGPFGLLGLDPASCTPSGVDAALERQLDRIAQHPDADSPAADAVRLALDNAASELLDPVMRAKWIAEYYRGRNETELLSEPAAAPVEPARPMPEFPVATPSPRTTQTRASAAVDLSREPSPRASGVSSDGFLRRMVLSFVIGIGVMLIGLAVGVWLLGPNRQGGGTAATPPTPSPVQPTPAPAPPTVATETAAKEPIPEPLAPLRARGRSEFVDGPTAVRDLRTAAAQFKTDPDRALARFERASAVVADWWCRYDASEIRAAADAVVESIFHLAARPDHLDKLLAVIVEPTQALSAGNRAIAADEVWPAAWSAGILARVNRERDLPPQTSVALANAMTGALASARPVGELSLDAGLQSAMRVLPAAILAGRPAVGDQREASVKAASAAIQRWIEAVTLTTSSDPDRRERQLVDALGYALTQAAEPDADPRVFEAIGLLAAEIKWRAGGPARPKLMDWFRDPRISNQDLRILTSALATRSSAEGVDQGMVLSMSATAEDRIQLRVRFADAWGIAEASSRAEAAHDWSTRARNAISAEPRDDELDQLAHAADLAELAREAFKLWRGESAPSAAALSAAAAPQSGKYAVSAGGGPGGGGPALGSITGEAADGAWAERFLAAERNIPIRLERLSELEQTPPPIGFIDAGVLAETACFGSPVQVRLAAQRTVAKFADEPAMVNAMLDLLPNAPRIRNVSDTYARVCLAPLPRPSDADWELTVRRALVERLLAMVADDGIHGQVEQLAARIAGAYLDAAGETLAGGSTDASAAGARRGAQLLSDQARREADGLPITRATRLNIEQIERRREQRRAQAIGPVQAFSAEQVGLAEITGYLVASERPERESAVITILDEMAASRRKSRHVFRQVWAVERAIVQLWLLRLGEEAPA